jgi:hypothetical protein
MGPKKPWMHENVTFMFDKDQASIQNAKESHHDNTLTSQII